MSSQQDGYHVGQRRNFMTVSLNMPDGVTVEGDVLDLSAYGCGAHFPLEGSPRLEPGTEVNLAFRALLLPTPLQARARVRSLVDENQHRTVRLEFVDPDETLRRVPYVLLREFNRRSDPRLPIEGVVQVNIQAGTDSESWTARLADISTGGAALNMTPEQGETMSTKTPLHIRFQLPDHPKSFYFVALVCGLREQTGAVECSVEFDENATPAFETQRKELEAYVSEHSRNQPPVTGS
jgi:c-di-GMP-binding flagellar brake protein YcgR